MNATRQLHDLGQSLWLDNITRGLLTSGTLGRYINDLSVTGLTSNPTIFEHAIKDADFYDGAIRQKALAGKSGEALFFELALEDLIRAADLFRPIHDATDGIDGWVSLEVSPLLADDTAGTIKAAAQLHARAQRPNLFIKIPGTCAGIPAIEETIFAGRAGKCHAGFGVLTDIQGNPMKVAQVAAKTGVSPYAIRYYARIGLLTPARESGNRYRRFTDADVKHLSFIRKAQKLGFTLKEIRKIFEKSRTGQTPCPLVREIVQRRVVENSKQLEQVVALQRNMERALRRWKKMPDHAPDGDAICHLIETHD